MSDKTNLVFDMSFLEKYKIDATIFTRQKQVNSNIATKTYDRSERGLKLKTSVNRLRLRCLKAITKSVFRLASDRKFSENTYYRTPQTLSYGEKTCEIENNKLRLRF